MADKNDESASSVVQRFQQADKQPYAAREKQQPKRVRVHSSIYVEQALLDRLSEAYKTSSHELYPLEVRKSAFIEACIAYALDHLPDIKRALSEDVP